MTDQPPLTLDWDKRVTRPAFAGHVRIDIPIQGPPADRQFAMRLSEELRRRLTGETRPLIYIAADVLTNRHHENVLTLLIAPELQHQESDRLWEVLLHACESCHP